MSVKPMSIQVAFLDLAHDGARGDVAHVGRLFKICNVKRQHDVYIFVAAVRVHGEVERMIAGKIEP